MLVGSFAEYLSMDFACTYQPPRLGNLCTFSFSSTLSSLWYLFAPMIYLKDIWIISLLLPNYVVLYVEILFWCVWFMVYSLLKNKYQLLVMPLQWPGLLLPLLYLYFCRLWLFWKIGTLCVIFGLMLTLVIILKCFYILLNSNFHNGWILIGSVAADVATVFVCTKQPPGLEIMFICYLFLFFWVCGVLSH